MVPRNRTKIPIMINVMVTTLEYTRGGVWEGIANFVKQLETVQTTAAEKRLFMGDHS